MPFIDKYNLVNKNRIDVVIGVEYVDFYENQYRTDFFIDLHIEHKRAFNGLREGKYKGKDAHLKRFNSIIRGIKDNKTNTVGIPVHKCGDEYWVINGFHRTSVLTYYNFEKNLEIETHPRPPSRGYYPTDIYFFKKKKYPQFYCDYTMQCFFKYHLKNFNCIILFPNSKSLSDELRKELHSKLIYDLSIPVDQIKQNSNFKNNFIQTLYYTENWCKKGGYKYKAKGCFNKQGDVTIYFVEKQPLDKLVDFKERVRDYYRVGKHSIHIPDTQEECDGLLDLLNSNTITFMDNAKSLYVPYQNFNKLFKKLKQFCKEKKVDPRNICVTSSSVLSVHGIRDCGDMDLFIDKKYVDVFKGTCFDNHNDYTIKKHYPNHFEDIIYNPANHFYYQGIKFCNLSIILAYKRYRVKHKLYGTKSITKDKKDISEMVTLLE